MSEALREVWVARLLVVIFICTACLYSQYKYGGEGAV